MAYTILVIDDDPDLLELIEYNLLAEGYSVHTSTDGLSGLKSFYTHHPDLIILDVSMPKLDGYEVCKRVREVAETPILMLTARGREEDIIKGLDLGADDYLTKPFKVGELLARARATLRRARQSHTEITSITYQDNYLMVDLDNRQVTIEGKPVKLTPTEYKLLAYLVKHKDRILEFEQILEQVWGFEYKNDVDYVRVYIWHLRRKLEPDAKNPEYFVSEANVGYKFVSKY